ncbi:MAG: hypothetical protein KUG74_13295 [Rhodobacteraceae bacterium]|nr:hypothetical protein [Paracoccaceae bacterium]
MLRILRKLFLTTLFAIFASQASAMFIQPDWLDPTQPGVGTNRYAYSHNDPVNKLDPNGNEAVTATGLGLGFIGLAIAEYASDFFNDGEINWNGVIGGGIQGVAGLIGDTAQGIFGGNSVHSESDGDDGSSSGSGSDSSGGGTNGDPNNDDDDDEPSDKEKQTANHIFGSRNLAKHGLKGLLSKFSNPIEATRAIKDATQSALDNGQISVDSRGVFSTDVSVQGIGVTVRGRAVNGIAEIGTAFSQ